MDQNFSHSLANFALRFNNELDNSKTTICSPLSAEIVLAMLALGCGGQSREELMQALGVPNDENIRSSFSLLTSHLKSIDGATLNMANRIYLKTGDNLKSEFKKDIEHVFDSDVEQLDFGEKNASADTINEWVSQRTSNLIKDIVSAETFDETTCIVLINAIHFKGNWATPFQKNGTKEQTFYLNNTTTIQVPLMYQNSIYLNYGESAELNAKILEMHYDRYQSSMVVVLPDEVEGLSSMLQQLAAEHDLMADIKALKWTKVDVMIPKFRAEAKIDLKYLLLKLGIKSIFEKKSSDFEMLTSSKQLFVSEAIQKAFIEVNEAGTEAAAACRPVMKECCMSRNPRFIADRPFLYLLLAKGIPIFVGAYRGPQ